MNRIILAGIIFLSFIGTMPSAYAQLATFDAVAVSKMLEQIEQGKKQLDQLRSQIGEMKKLYGSLNGITDLSSLRDMLNNKNIQAALPPNFSDFEKLLNGESDKAAKWGDKFSYKEPPGGAGSKAAVDEFYRNELAKTKKQNQGMAATAETAYDAAIETKNTIESLAQKLKNAETTAAKQDIQAQLAAAQAMLQTQLLTLQAATILKQSQVEAAKVRQDEEHKARYLDYARQLRGE
ncbi:type IV secretion protein VblB5 [Bartonella australis AUST/NH1]|uniref:Type IV secretion protein VblB5 n=1 Tax=Bartonella australis (strain Aust/NH1) TaxID=1094489 RepID=M1NZU3_BARAA|nr:type IV secretion system protein [Bartonella australis]AGF74927.1 type IV secretion protein VblB5 [Bartonella australis AUST/NH1]